eukprot:TRINITY_DN2384_c0_g1_i2.p1 TRINITY_DN2384_c0_g1~~TRINITY_DN2384_c0_g1_i2.p1  ORF type:complete len:346 (+),score=19.10 TRINITY_DN2384_c0_g1_i2:29-1066(+)
MAQDDKQGPSCPRWRFGPRWYTVLQILNIISLLFHIAVGLTTFSQALLYGGNSNKTLGRFGARYTWLTPARAFFSFWGFIWFTLILFSIYQLLPIHRMRNGFLQRINFAFTAANILSGLQLIFYPLDLQPLCTIIMILDSVAVVYIWIQINFRDRPTFATKSNKHTIAVGWRNWEISGRTERILFFWLVQFPQTLFGVWVGASTTVQLHTAVNYAGHTTEVWATLNWSIAWQVVLASIIIFSTAWAWDWPFGGCALLAYGSIAVEQQKNDYRLYLTAIVLAGLIAGTTLSVLVFRTLRFFKKLPRWDKYESDEEDSKSESEMESKTSGGRSNMGVSDLLGPSRRV